MNQSTNQPPVNQKFQNAIQGIAQQCPPVWMMRQAGRYHRHYQALRAKHSFMDLCKVPELAAEVALGPVEDFDFDVSILFSDLLFPLEALGMGLEYTDKGPRLGFQLRSENVKQLKSVGEALPALSFQQEAMRRTREILPKNKSLIGFVGGPWTLFVYACEGSHSGSLTYSKVNHELYKTYCEKMVPLLIQNIELQFAGGAEVVMILDTACGEVSPLYFQEYLQPQLLEISRAFPGRLGYYSKGSQPEFFNSSDWQSAPWAGQGYDHRTNLLKILPEKNRKGIVQGNFDQSLLFYEPAEFQRELRKYLHPLAELSPDQRKGWVCGLGHGLLPKTPEENVRSFVQIVREVFA